MEINKYSDIQGVVAQEDIVEGRMVLLTERLSGTYDFGSRADLPGVKLPDTAAEARMAKYVSAFAVDNRSIPLYQTIPSFTFALRQGWDQSQNVPFSTQVYMTHPGNMESQTIPSGEPCLAFGGGVFTVPSGQFVENANLVPGAMLEVLNAADDGEAEAGKLNYTTTVADAVAVVHRYDSTNLKLTFRTLQP